MNTDQHATAWPKLCVFATVLGVLAMIAGCTTTTPEPYPLSSGRIGVAVVSTQAELATAKNVGAACQEKLDAEYAGLSEKYSEIVRRELSLSDLQRQFVTMLRERTWAPVVEVGAPYGADSADRQQQLLSAAVQRGLEHLFVVGIQNVRIGADFEGDCGSWFIAVDLRLQLWSVAERKLVIDGRLGAPYAYGKFSELKSVLDEPGALHARLVSILEAAATRLLYDSRFLFPP